MFWRGGRSSGVTDAVAGGGPCSARTGRCVVPIPAPLLVLHVLCVVGSAQPLEAGAGNWGLFNALTNPICPPLSSCFCCLRGWDHHKGTWFLSLASWVSRGAPVTPQNPLVSMYSYWIALASVALQGDGDVFGLYSHVSGVPQDLVESLFMLQKERGRGLE